MEYGLLSAEDARIVLQTIRQIRESGILLPAMRSRYLPPTIAPVYIHNAADETIPPFACIQITGTEEIGGQNYLLADKPADTDGGDGWYLFNSGYEVEKDGEGIAQSGPVFRAFYDTGTITAGDAWGPVANQWYIAATGGGPFIVCGEDDIEEKCVKVITKGGGGDSQRLFATPSGGIPAASGSPPGTVTVPAALCTEYDWQTAGTFAAIPTANTSLVYNITDQTIAGNVLIKAARVKGYWVVDTASCGANGTALQSWF